MAKTVQPIAIELGIKGEEKLAALSRSFRDLSKQVKFSDADIIQATKDVAKFAQEAGNSEATIKGQIKAFEGLREQATMGGKAYIQLGKDIESLKVTLRGSTDEMEQQRAAFVKTGNAAKSSASDIAGVISQLENLRNKARPGSSAFAQLGKDIAALKSQLQEANVEVKKFNAGFEISQRPAMSLEKIQRQIGRLAEGLKTLNFISDDFLNTQERIALLGQVQSRTVGRQQVRATEQLFSSQAFENFVQGPAGRLDLPRTAAALNLEISELQEQLANTVPGSKYADLTVEIANKQKELNKILDVTADAYDRVAAAQDRSARVAEKISGIQEYQRSTGGIAAGVGGFRDPDTGAIIARGTGSIQDRRAFRAARAELANAIIDGAVRQARTLALPAAGGTTAPGTGAAMSGMARRELPYDIDPQTGQRVLRSGAAETTRRPLAPADLPRDYLERSRATLAAAPSAAVGVAPGVGFGEQVIKKQVSALKEAAAAYRPYNKAIRDARAANNDSISSINNLKNALIAKRNEVPTTSAAFRRLTSEIENLDRKSERVSRRMRGRRMSAGQLAQAAGATISGGIFGGPEGFLGGAIGTAFGGAGGAFAGAAIGAQVGGLRRELGGYAEYAAQIEKLKIALKGLTKDQSEFNYALAASQKVTQDFNIPQQESIRGITRLAAAVKGAGGPLTDAEVVFRNVTTAIKATGGSAQDVEGAVTAMVQVFSKGKVSAEELSGQLGERLPGAVTMFAKANNMSLVELQDNLKAGTVGLNELMKFVRSLGDTYGTTARKISDSNADAGARLQVVVNDMKTAIGDALIPIGAQLQDAFGKFLQEITPTLVEVLPKIGELFLGIVKNLDLIAQAAAAVFAVVVVGKITAIIASIGSLSAAIFTLKLNAIVATKALIGLNAAALLNPYVALAAGAAALGVAIFRAAQEQKRLNTLIREGSVADIDKQLAENRSEIIKIEQRQLNPGLFYDVSPGSQGTSLSPRQRDIQNLEKYRDAEKKLQEARKRAVYDATQGADLPENLLRPFDYQSPKGDGDGKGGSAKEKKERKSQLESINARLTLLDIDKMIRANAREIVEAQADNNFERVKELSLQKLSLASQKEFASVQLDYRDALAKAAGDENEQMLKAEAAASRDRAIQELRFKLKEDMLDLEQQSRLEQEARTRAAEDEVFALREQLGLVSDQERISRYRTNLEEQGTPNADELTDLYRQTVDPTFAEGISQNIRALKKDLEELLDPVNQVTGAANAIGTAFTDSFMSAITGSATAQEALANFFSNTAKYFLDMAAQIIQKMIVMAILNQVVRVLPGGGGFKFSGGSADAGLNTANLMGGITPFAMGGIVDKPTMFAYANGGVGRFGIMGEAGPEAILPLQRGPGGKLGVQASGSSVGDVVVNVDASGTRAQGDNQSATQLGNVIGAAVQAELIKQKRPGGLLA
jgi:tape measure domain-containing protein